MRFEHTPEDEGIGEHDEGDNFYDEHGEPRSRNTQAEIDAVAFAKFCDDCSEPDCLVSMDGTCARRRKEGNL